MTTNRLHFRHFHADTDLSRLARLLEEAEAVDHAGEDISERALREQLSLPGHDPVQDRWVVEDPDNAEQFIGFGAVWKVPLNKHADIYGVVHPRWRGQGIGSELLQRIITRTRELGPQHIFASAYVQHPEANRFLHKHAFSPLAAYTEMKASAHLSLPQPQWPAGYVIKQYDPTTDFSTLLYMYNSCFQGLWGHWETVTEEDLRRFPAIQSGGIFLLFGPDGQPVGTCRGEISEELSARRGKRTGYVDSPGIVPQQRQDRLYLPLLLQAMQWIRAQEQVDIELESWGDSEEVLASYQSIGFEVTRQARIYNYAGS